MLELEENLKKGLLQGFEIVTEAPDRLSVFTPFTYDDGDHLGLVIKQEDGRWVVSDEGNAYMRLSMYFDPTTLIGDSSRARLLTSILDAFGVIDREGELIVRVKGDNLGGSIYAIFQALTQIADIRFLSQERVKPTFLEDFRSIFSSFLPENSYKFNWTHPEYDRSGLYPVDCNIKASSTPIFIYAVNNDRKLSEALVGMYSFREHNVPFKPMTIIEKEESINQKSWLRLQEICDSNFVDLRQNKIRISETVLELMEH